MHRQTELYARWLLENQAAKIDFNTPEEANMVDEVFDSALAGLPRQPSPWAELGARRAAGRSSSVAEPGGYRVARPCNKGHG